MNKILGKLGLLFFFIFQCVEIRYHKISLSFYTLLYLKKTSLIFIFIIALFTMEGCTPALISSAIDGDITKVRNLLDKGTDVNIKNEQTYYYYYTALMSAAGNGHTEIVKLLIDKGADLNDIAPGWEKGVSPLMAAASHGHTEIVKLLLDAGADVNIKNPNGCNAIWFAINTLDMNIEIVRYLLNKGADVNAETIWGPTWLIVLTNPGKDKMVKQLITNHINIPSGKAYLVIPDHWITVKLNEDIKFYESPGLRPLKTCYRIIDPGQYRIYAGISVGDERSGGWHSIENKELNFAAKEEHIYFINFKIIETPELFKRGSWDTWIEEYVGKNNAEN